MAKTDREGSSFGALWKNLAQQYPRHSAHAWRSCWKEINAAEQAAGNGKKLKAPFSPEDEEALIEFLAAGGPKPNLSWKDFAVQAS
ncbi:hypothetical protein DL93DRAFT_2076903 [Clavulina sp. PMI_390]|nr:hypothetical protein DL93DRAFT_2076903 [Clavulina sp. PMI_390]